MDQSTIRELLVAETVKFPPWLDLVLKVKNEMEAGELRGLCIRALESQADHPGLLLARAVAETMCSDHDDPTTRQSIAAALGAAKDKYAIPEREIDAAVEALFDLSTERAPELGPPLTAELLELGDKRPDFDPLARRALVRVHDHPDDRVHAILEARRLGELVENIRRAHTRRAGEYKALISENAF